MEYFTYVVGEKKKLNLKNMTSSYLRCETNGKETYHGRIRCENVPFLIETSSLDVIKVDNEKKVLHVSLDEKTMNVLQEVEDYCKSSLNELLNKYNILENENKEEFIRKVFKSNIKQVDNNSVIKVSIKDDITTLTMSSDDLEEDGKEINFENISSGDKARLILELRSVNIIPNGELAFLEIICQALDVEKSNDVEINVKQKLNVGFKNKKVFTKSKVIELDTSNIISEAQPPPPKQTKKNTKAK